MSRSIPRGPLVVRANLPRKIRETLLEALLTVHDRDPAAAHVLNVAPGERFSVATQSAPATLKSIAQLAGVSYATVSRAISGRGAVSAETARRVQAIVDELGYRPNGHALTLHGRAAPLVGLVQHAGAASDALLDDVRRQLAALGVPLVLCPVDGRLSESPYLELLMDGRFGALVVSPRHASEPEVVRVARTGRLVICVDADAEVAESSIVRTLESELVATLARSIGRF
jgi:LacI family transcriptional regulator